MTERDQRKEIRLRLVHSLFLKMGTSIVILNECYPVRESMGVSLTHREMLLIKQLLGDEENRLLGKVSQNDRYDDSGGVQV